MRMSIVGAIVTSLNLPILFKVLLREIAQKVKK